ncbi:MAG: tetratricopeptide repeat protein [Deltaproteobacteria bacterium]|nr:tetratricopeptide repeat protein [Deltaproteobacteria bacterium]
MGMEGQWSVVSGQWSRLKPLVFFPAVFLFLFFVACASTPVTTTQNRKGDAETHFALGGAYYRKGLLDEAAQEWRRVLAIYPGHRGARFNLGLVSGDKGFLDEAISNYEKVISTNPDDARAHYNLGLAYRCSGRLDEAISEYKKALGINGGSTEFEVSLHNNLA